jgi:hypothetical protein
MTASIHQAAVPASDALPVHQDPISSHWLDSSVVIFLKLLLIPLGLGLGSLVGLIIGLSAGWIEFSC